MSDGVRSTNFPLVSLVDELLGNRSGATGRIAVDNFASQLLSSGPMQILTNVSKLFATFAELAAAPVGDFTPWVYADPDPLKNGIYRRVSSAWVWSMPLPYSFVQLHDAGAGTPNAIQLISLIPTSPVVLRVANVFEANTGNVTLSENGAPARPLLTNSGNQIAPGGLVANMLIAYLDDGANFRLITDQVSSAIVAEAEAAALAAANYAALARNDKVVRAYVGNGATVDFALPADPGSANNITVNMSGAQQFKSAYSLVYIGTSPVVPTLRFSEAPPNGTPFEAEMGYAVSVGVPSTGSVGASQLADNAVTLAKLADIATMSLIGRKTAGTGDPEVIGLTDLRDLFLPNGSTVDSGFASYAANTALTVALPTDDTMPQITEGTEILKVTLTPKKTTNKFKARAIVIGSVNAADNWGIALFAAGAANALDAKYAPPLTANFVSVVVLEWEWVPGVTSAVDVTIRAGSNPGRSLYLNGSSAGRIFGGASHCTLSVKEIKAGP